MLKLISETDTEVTDKDINGDEDTPIEDTVENKSIEKFKNLKINY